MWTFSLMSMNLSSHCVLLFGERLRMEKRIFSDRDAPVQWKVCRIMAATKRFSLDFRFIHNSILPAIKMHWWQWKGSRKVFKLNFLSNFVETLESEKWWGCRENTILLLQQGKLQWWFCLGARDSWSWGQGTDWWSWWLWRWWRWWRGGAGHHDHHGGHCTLRCHCPRCCSAACHPQHQVQVRLCLVSRALIGQCWVTPSSDWQTPFVLIFKSHYYGVSLAPGCDMNVITQRGVWQ